MKSCVFCFEGHCIHVQFFVIFWTFVEANLAFIFYLYCSHEELYRFLDN